jgi:hypothetical protein
MALKDHEGSPLNYGITKDGFWGFCDLSAS